MCRHVKHPEKSNWPKGPQAGKLTLVVEENGEEVKCQKCHREIKKEEPRVRQGQSASTDRTAYGRQNYCVICFEASKGCLSEVSCSPLPSS